MKKLTDTRKENEQNRGYLTEFIGSFFLTFVSCWSLIQSNLFQKEIKSGALLIALAPSIVLYLFLYLGGRTHNASLNPAVTFSMMILQRQSWAVGTKYIILQLTGAIIAGGFIFIELTTDQYKKLQSMSILGIPTKGSNYDSSVIIGEFIGSFMLGFVYTAIFTKDPKKDYGRIGAAGVCFIYFVALLSLTEVYGVGLNPARSVGPAIIAGQFGTLQLYQIFSPLFGCLFGSVLQNSIYAEEEGDEEKEALDESQSKLNKSDDQKEIELEEH